MLFSLRQILEFFTGPSNLTDACILRSSVKCEDCSRISDLSRLHKSSKLKDELHLRKNSQLTLDAAMDAFASGQFKTRLKKMAAQVNFYLYLNAVILCLKVGIHLSNKVFT